MWRRGLVAASSLGVSYGAYKYNTDEGTRRMAQLYGKVAPIVIHYRLIEAKHKYWPSDPVRQDEEWEALHDRYADKLLTHVRSLAGFYTKIGQVMAGRPDTLPLQYCEKLQTLEDDMPYRSFEEVKQPFHVSSLLSSSVLPSYSLLCRSCGAHICTCVYVYVCVCVR